MDGDIRATEQLQVELRQSILRLTRKIQLNQLKADAFRAFRARLEREESDIIEKLKVLKEAEAVYKREAASIRESLTAKSMEFSEATSGAADRLLNVALQRENGVLQGHIERIKKEIEQLGKETDGYPDIDEKTLSSQLASVRDLRRRHAEVVQRQQVVEALVSRALEAATRANRHDEDDMETDYGRQIEEAVEDMSQLLSRKQAEKQIACIVRDGEGTSTNQVRADVLLAKLAVERDRERTLRRVLADCLAEKVRRNTDLYSKVREFSPSQRI